MAERTRGKTGKKRLVKTLIVGPFRMAFPALLSPEETDNGERYKCGMLFPPDSKSIHEIEDAMLECMEDEFGPEDKGGWPDGKKDTLPEDKFWDAGRKEGKPGYNGFKKDWWFLSASSQDAPGVIDIDKNEVMSKREVYGGRWARAQIAVTAFDNNSKGVTAYLNHVQLLEHDEAFSGRGDASSAFADDYKLTDKGSKRGSRDEDDDRRDRGRDRSESRDRDEDGDRTARGSRDRDRDEDAPRGDREGRSRARDTEGEDRPRRDRAVRDEREDDRPRRTADRDADEPRRSGRRDDRDDDTRGRGRDDRGTRRSRDADDDDQWN